MISQRYRMLLLKLSVGVLMLSMMMACFGEPEFPKEPEIEYAWIENHVVDSKYDSVYVGITFRDGDGDLGLTAADTLYPYGPYEDDKLPEDTVENKFRNNYFVTVLRKEDTGEFEPVAFEVDQFNGRFPMLNESGRDRPLEGELRYSALKLYKGVLESPLKEGDSLKFRIHIADRALNESNEVTTMGIELGQPKEREEVNPPPPVEGD